MTIPLLSKRVAFRTRFSRTKLRRFRRELFFLLTFLYNLIHLTLYKTSLGVRELAPAFLSSRALFQRNPFCSAKHISLKSTTYEMQICKSFALIFMQNAGGGGSTAVSTIHCVTARILSVPAQSVWKLPRCGLPTTCWQQLHLVGGKLREGVRRRLFKPREPAAKHKLHHVGRAIPLLGDA